MQVGQVIRSLRKTRHLTLAELAQRSTVDQATLSRIETSKMLGTVASHRLIAHALGLRLAQLYEALDADAAHAQPAPRAATATTHAPGDASWQVLTTAGLQKKMLPLLIALKPRGRTTLETLPAGTERFLYVLEGAITAVIQGQRHPLTARQTLYFDAHLPHQLLNLAARPARCLSVLTPPAL